MNGDSIHNQAQRKRDETKTISMKMQSDEQACQIDINKYQQEMQRREAELNNPDKDQGVVQNDMHSYQSQIEKKQAELNSIRSSYQDKINQLEKEAVNLDQKAAEEDHKQTQKRAAIIAANLSNNK